MKNLIFCIIMISLTLLYGCGPYNVTNSKPGQPIDPVTNLNDTVSGTNVKLAWKLPSSYPADIKQPVSVYIIVRVDNVEVATETVDSAPTSYTYTSYDSSKLYSFTVKVEGSVNTSDKFAAHTRYSSGETVYLK